MQAEMRANMSIFGLTKVDFIALTCDSHLAPAADRGNCAIRAKGVQKDAGRWLGHKALDSCSRASGSRLFTSMRIKAHTSAYERNVLW